MRVLQFGRYDFDQTKGGVQFYAELVARYIGPDVQMDQLVSGEGPKTLVKQTPNGTKVAVASFGLFASVPISPTFFYWAWKLLRTRDYQVLHLNFPDPLSLIAVLLLSPKQPIVVTWHSDIVRQKKLIKYYQPLVRFFMKRVKRVLVATPRHLESCPQLQEMNMENQLVVTPFGIEEKRFELTPERARKVSELRAKYQGRFILFAMGRHVYYKGFEYLIDAMKDLSNCQLILGGSGPMSEELKSRSDLLKVEFVGSLSFEDLVVHLHACDLFCFPSVDKTEAFGYAQVEAMICGKAVVGSDLQNGVSFVNLNEVTGLTVPPRDSKALVRAIRRLQEDPVLLKKLSHQAQTRALQEFTAQKTADRTKKVYYELIST
ncbi:MAG: glycosyltransferase [Pseudobdellovibrionaceae bacterium]